ncbi:T9SS type A sorting domain-containing protein [Litoribaculum gwangyangense]|uniref:Secretion system C-terminal sorting domain-containing protein n=1 Tax=Litoribaculum gwangyangense TaxID=1130722 RepID=A0ABP9CPA6_9FLAO
MKKTTLKGAILLLVLVFIVQNFSFAQGAVQQANTVRDGQTYRIRNMATGNYLGYDDVIGKYAPVAFNAADVNQVHRFMTNTTAVPGFTYYTIDMGGPDESRGIMRIAGAGASFQVFSTTVAWDASSGQSDKVQNVWELGSDVILIQSKTADSYLTEMDQAFFDANGFWYQGPSIIDPSDLRQQWKLEPGTITLSTEAFDTSSIFVSNPVKNELSIKGLTPNVKEVSVYSLLGQKVLTKEVEGNSSLTVDVSRLTSGLYLVEMKGERGSFTKKIVKE